MSKVTMWTETALQFYIFKALRTVSENSINITALKNKGREEKECPDKVTSLRAQQKLMEPSLL